MNEKIPQKMYGAFWEEDRKDGPSRMRAALLWLADNVSDEMVEVVAHATSGDEFRQQPEEDFNEWTRRLRKAAISAALRAAGDGR